MNGRDVLSMIIYADENAFTPLRERYERAKGEGLLAFTQNHLKIAAPWY